LEDIQDKREGYQNFSAVLYTTVEHSYKHTHMNTISVVSAIYCEERISALKFTY